MIGCGHRSDPGQIRRKQYAIYRHAITESFKDGLSVSDLLYVVLYGEIIEEYPDRQRCLIYAMCPNSIPVHVVVDYSWQDEIQIVTAYIPDDREWISFRVRRKRRR